MDKDRRTFIKKISLAAGMINLPGLAGQITDSLPAMEKNDQLRLSNLKKPLAIAMWDFSWIIRLRTCRKQAPLPNREILSSRNFTMDLLIH